MASGPPVDTARSARLQRLVSAVYKGKLALTVDNQLQFLEGIYTQDNAVNAITVLVSSEHGLKALQTALFMDCSIPFLNDKAPLLLEFLQSPDLTVLNKGAFLSDIITHIVHPTTFWLAFSNALIQNQLQERAQKAFIWLFLRVHSLPEDSPSRNVIDEDELLDSLLSSQYPDIRKASQKSKKTLSSSIRAVSGQDSNARHNKSSTDYRHLPIIPPAHELFTATLPPSRTRTSLNNPNKKIASPEDHLSNLFRVLREDMLYEVREEVKIVLGNVPGRKHGGFALDGLKLHSIYHDNLLHRNSTRISFTFECTNEIKGMGKFEREEDRKRFLSQQRRILDDGGLCLLLDDGEPFAFATIHRDESLLAQKPSIVVLQLKGDAFSTGTLIKIKSAKAIKLIQIDSTLFSHEPTLKALQSMTSLPLESEILFWNRFSRPTSVPCDPGIQEIIDRLRLNPHMDLQPLLNSPDSIFLDKYQAASLVYGLANRVTLIEGPPGTGKSLIAALLTKSFFEFTDHTIFFICHTTHALDRFIESLSGTLGIHNGYIYQLRAKLPPTNQPAPAQNNHYPHYETTEIEETCEELLDGFSRFTAYTFTDKDAMEFLEARYPQIASSFYVPLSYHRDAAFLPLQKLPGSSLKRPIQTGIGSYSSAN